MFTYALMESEERTVAGKMYDGVPLAKEPFPRPKAFAIKLLISAICSPVNWASKFGACAAFAEPATRAAVYSVCTAATCACKRVLGMSVAGTVTVMTYAPYEVAARKPAAETLPDAISVVTSSAWAAFKRCCSEVT